MRNVQSGFTLIELVVVIVILGILAAVAIPKFVDLSAEATQAALNGVAGGLGSAMAINYAGCSAVGNVVTAGKCVAVTDCNTPGVLTGGVMPATYSITAAAIAAPAGTTNATCTVTKLGTTLTGTFTGIRAGP